MPSTRTIALYKGYRVRALPSSLTLLTQLLNFLVVDDTQVNGVPVDWMLF